MALGFKKKTAPDDFGFGDKIARNGERLFNSDGSFNVIRKGRTSFEPYMWLIETNWFTFSAVVFLFCVILNALFAGIYVLIGIETITEQPPESFLVDFADAFFFSLQTFTTVGYGALNPHGITANIVAALDALIGLLAFALATGLFFGRVAKPKPLLLYSKNAVIRPFNGQRAFMFRITNGRHHKIINLKAKVIMSWREQTDTSQRRRYYTFNLERDEVTLLPLSWTLVNIFDQDHPLYGKSWAEIVAMNIEVVIQIEGYDQTFNQLIFSNHSYLVNEILWNHKYVLMFEDTGKHTILHMDKLSATEEMKEEED